MWRQRLVGVDQLLRDTNPIDRERRVGESRGVNHGNRQSERNVAQGTSRDQSIRLRFPT